MLLVQFLSVDQVLAVLGGSGSREIILDPLQLRVGVKVELMPLQGIMQLLLAIRHCWLHALKPVKVTHITHQ